MKGRTTASSSPPGLRSALVIALVACGCAASGGAGKGFDGRARQATERLPAAAGFYDEAERALVEEAQAHQPAARKLVEEGDLEKARAAFGEAAERYGRFADVYPASEWRLAFRFKAAEFLLFAQRQDRAAEHADKVLADPAANDVTKAMAAQLAAVAWRGVAVQRVKAGELEPIKLATVEQRAGAPLARRAPPEPWARFVAAVDAYLPVWEKHPEVARLPAERNLALTPWAGALIAAEVKFSCDDMAEAQRRLDQIVDTWPAELDVMETAVPLLLQTFLVRRDDAGFGAAADRVKRILDRQIAAAVEARARESLSKLRDQVDRLRQHRDFDLARRLMEDGKAAEAAVAFERFADAYGAAGDAAVALFNAAHAWEAAGQPEKAAAAREALVARHGDSAKAPLAALLLAGGASKRGDHRGRGALLRRLPRALARRAEPLPRAAERRARARRPGRQGRRCRAVLRLRDGRGVREGAAERGRQGAPPEREAPRRREAEGEGEGRLRGGDARRGDDRPCGAAADRRRQAADQEVVR